MLQIINTPAVPCFLFYAGPGAGITPPPGHGANVPVPFLYFLGEFRRPANSLIQVTHTLSFQVSHCINNTGSIDLTSTLTYIFVLGARSGAEPISRTSALTPLGLLLVAQRRNASDQHTSAFPLSLKFQGILLLGLQTKPLNRAPFLQISFPAVSSVFLSCHLQKHAQ